MARRSVQATPTGISAAKRAYNLVGWTQTRLAEQVHLSTRQPISKFFAGKPVDRQIFIEICRALDLNWEEIAEPPANQPAAQPLENDAQPEVDALVQALRTAIAPTVRKRCGTMRVLDMEQPIALTGEAGVYTNVHILERLTGNRRLGIAELMKQCGVEEFDRFGLSRITEERVSGLEAVKRYDKLLALGKPGAGKSTFLKWLAMQCIEGLEFVDRVPFFIPLKEFAEAQGQPDLLTYLHQIVTNSLAGSLSTTQALLLTLKATEPIAVPLSEILAAGRAFVLLDGLDEVREEDTKRVLRQIREFSEQFHANQFVMTCRIAAKEYTFEQFREVEVSDFSSEQIADFVWKWFHQTDPQKAEKFIQRLEENKPIQELASSPLLLTLLCLMFGETADFPTNRSELYKEGLDVLLKKWDGKRNIERQQVYQNLSIQRKENLLSAIALTTFEQKEYFFKQKTVEAYIADFLQNLHNQDSDPEMLRLDSEAVLKSIEAQHGLLIERAKNIYSFSHLTFQEYFTAREIVAISAYEALVIHITEPRWREVFLLTVGMMRNADRLVTLMKQQADKLIAADETLQKYLTWVSQKSKSVNIPYKPAVVRAFYFALALDLALALAPNLDRVPDLALDRALALTLSLDQSPDRSLDRVFSLNITTNSEFHGKLQALKHQLLGAISANCNDNEQWWQAHGRTWRENLRLAMLEHRNIGHNWQFSDKQKELLRQYYQANLLLINCLNSDCYVSRDVRQKIEATLLLPMSEIEAQTPKDKT